MAGMNTGIDKEMAAMLLKKDDEIERLRAALENAEQFLDLFVNGASSLADGRHTLAHIREALRVPE